jgi:hypothetical protein
MSTSNKSFNSNNKVLKIYSEVISSVARRQLFPATPVKRTAIG